METGKRGPAETRLRKLLGAIEHEQGLGFASLGVLKVLLAAENACPKSYEHNQFLWAILGISYDHLIMTTARLLERNSGTTSLFNFCNYAEQHPSEFEWQFSENGQLKVRNGRAVLKERCEKWRVLLKNPKLEDQIKVIRDKLLAHRDKTVWIAKDLIGGVPLAEIELFLTDVGKLIDDFRELINNSSYEGRFVYEQVVNAGIATLGVEEAALELLCDYNNLAEKLTLAMRSHKNNLKREIDKLTSEIVDKHAD